jgi:opacity protein-like surface antigen
MIMKWTTIVVCMAGLVASQSAIAQTRSGSAGRAGTWETRLGVAFQQSASADFNGGTTADFDSDEGLRLGFGYHYTDNLEVGMNFGYGQTDYSADLVGNIGETPATFPIRGEFEYFTFSGDLTYNFLDGPFSPFVVAALGWSWIDTNIATGPPETGCWWDPWWGYVCTTFQDTKSLDGVTYQLGAGARYDFSDTFAVHASYRVTWIDLDNAKGTPDFDGFEVSVGWKF